MSRLTLTIVFCLSSFLAWANPALTGQWSGEIQGTTIAMTVDGKGGGNIDGVPMRYQLAGRTIFIERRGQVIAYSYELRSGQLLIGGGDLPGLLVMNKGSAGNAGAGAAAGSQAPAQSANRNVAGGVLPELVGKWCQASTFTANAGGGSQRSSCFELRGNGTYVYTSSGSMSAYAPGAWGGTSSSSGDAGRWSATANSITTQSNSGKTNTYPLEKRNHQKTRDPMLCLDGECYVTYWQKPRW